MFLVRTWTHKYKGRSSQFLPTTFLRYKFPNKIPKHKIPKFPNNFRATRIPLDTQFTKNAVRSFTTPSVLPQYFPNAVKKFPNQMLRNIPRMDFNAEFARYNAVGQSRTQ